MSRNKWFSDFQKNVGKNMNVIKSDGRYAGCEKLVPHLYEHKDYAIHYRNLKFVKELGVEISDVSKIVSFEQKAWLKPYIDFNTDKRKEAKNDFEKDFCKVVNNAVFGKTMENFKTRMKLHLTTNHNNAVKLFSKPTFKDSKSYNGLYLIEMYHKEIVYDKPTYLGTSILDLSKSCVMTSITTQSRET